MNSLSKRRPTDTLPGYVAINVTQSQAGLMKSGFLPASYSPFHIDTATGLGAYSMDEGSRQEFLRRWETAEVDSTSACGMIPHWRPRRFATTTTTTKAPSV